MQITLADLLGIRRRLVTAATMALVAATSFLLLVYVGFGEANRSYEQFYVGKLSAQAKVLVNAVEGFLKRDLPLDQYVGFRPRAERLRSSDQSVASIVVFDNRNNIIFRSGDLEIGLLPKDDNAQSVSPGDIEVRRDDIYLQAILPLRTDRETVGGIAIAMAHKPILEQVQDRFLWIVPTVLFLSLGFAVFVACFADWLSRQRWPILQTVYAGLFLILAVLVVSSLFSLYTKGAQIKTKALADSLGQRMTEVVGFNLDITKIPGLDHAFSEYRRLNPDIAAAALVVDNEILIHTDSFMVGRPWEATSGHYEYLVDISPRGSGQKVNIAVILPKEIIYWQTIRSVKNFAALFIASAFLASLFLQIAGTFNQRDGPNQPKASPEDEEHALRLVKPAFYVTMCVEHLSYAFLASYINELIDASGMAPGLTATVFAVYYLCFALALVPAGHLAQQFNPKPLMIFGLFLSGISFALLLDGGIAQLILGRAAAGVGQAMLFIGVQSFIFNVAAPNKKTQGAAIIVYGFQGGMISGMAIGSLLVSYIGPSGVFVVGAVAMTLTLTYAVAMVPSVNKSVAEPTLDLRGNMAAVGRHVILATKDSKLLQAITLIGIPAKAVLTGVVVFAIPLLMTTQGYRQEDIGQLLMLYAVGVVLANEGISRWVDRTGNTSFVLLLGALLSAFALLLIGRLGWGWFDNFAYGSALEVGFVLIGVILLGLAHGLINAPIVSHVAALDISQRIGVPALTATYRFLERIGHVAGPLIVGQMFIIFGDRAAVLTWIGLGITVLGFMFWWTNPGRRVKEQQPSGDGAGLGRTDLHIDKITGLHLDDGHQAFVLSFDQHGVGPGSDPAQNVLFTHLFANGSQVDLANLATMDYGANEPSNISTIISHRQSARRFTNFLWKMAENRKADHGFLVIVCSPHLHHEVPKLAHWLESHGGSYVVALPTTETWLEHVRGWLTLMSFDETIGKREKVVDELIMAFRDHLHISENSDQSATVSAAISASEDKGAARAVIAL